MQINIYEAKAKLSHLIERALKGDEIIIARGNRPLVRLEALPLARAKRFLGEGRGIVLSMAPDFDEPLDDFSEFMT